MCCLPCVFFFFLQAADLSKPIDKRIYKGTQPTCHDFNHLTATAESVSLLVGFSAGQVQLIDPIKKETSKLFNEEVSSPHLSCEALEESLCSYSRVAALFYMLSSVVFSAVFISYQASLNVGDQCPEFVFSSRSLFCAFVQRMTSYLYSYFNPFAWGLGRWLRE